MADIRIGKNDVNNLSEMLKALGENGTLTIDDSLTSEDIVIENIDNLIIKNSDDNFWHAASLTITNCKNFTIAKACVEALTIKDSSGTIKNSSVIKKNDASSIFINNSQTTIFDSSMGGEANCAYMEIENTELITSKLAFYGYWGAISSTWTNDEAKVLLVASINKCSWLRSSNVTFKNSNLATHSQFAIRSANLTLDECNVAIHHDGTSENYFPLFIKEGSTIVDNGSTWQTYNLGGKRIFYSESNSVLTLNSKSITHDGCIFYLHDSSISLKTKEIGNSDNTYYQFALTNCRAVIDSVTFISPYILHLTNCDVEVKNCKSSENSGDNIPAIKQKDSNLHLINSEFLECTVAKPYLIESNNSHTYIDSCNFKNRGRIINGVIGNVHIKNSHIYEDKLTDSHIITIEKGDMNITKSTIISHDVAETNIKVSTGKVISDDNDYRLSSSPTFSLDNSHLVSTSDLYDITKDHHVSLLNNSTSNLPLKYDDKKIDEIILRLDNTAGLHSAKEALQTMLNVSVVNLHKQQQNTGHMRIIFNGGAGSGKALVSKYIGSLYKSFNLIESDTVTSLSFSTMMSNDNKSKGNTILLKGLPPENAYSDVNLCKAIDAFENTTLVILALSDEDLSTVQRKYPSLHSRFTKKIDFPTYTDDELLYILKQRLALDNINVTDDAQSYLLEYFKGKKIELRQNFSNGRFVLDLIKTILDNQANRLAKDNFGIQNPDSLYVVTREDIPKMTHQDNSNLPALLAELDSMTGLDAIKQNIHQIVSLIKANKRREAKELTTSMHLVFSGNPGTGKTTVARLIGSIYQALGVLPTGQLIETDRSGLVAQYIGHTAIKTKDVVQSAMGGILFIDEAYTLASPTTFSNDFGQEAINTLLKLMEDNRKDFAVIVAGYPDLMKQFLESNPGLKSRFSKELIFEDYSIDELVDIFKKICTKQGFTYTDGLIEKVSKALKAKMNSSSTTQRSIGFIKDSEQSKEVTPNAYFGNAREVRNLFESILETQSIRVADDESSDPWQFIDADLK